MPSMPSRWSSKASFAVRCTSSGNSLGHSFFAGAGDSFETLAGAFFALSNFDLAKRSVSSSASTSTGNDLSSNATGSSDLRLRESRRNAWWERSWRMREYSFSGAARELDRLWPFAASASISNKARLRACSAIIETSGSATSPRSVDLSALELRPCSFAHFTISAGDALSLRGCRRCHCLNARVLRRRTSDCLAEACGSGAPVVAMIRRRAEI
mmetsp:Transcript_31326/g.105470  ORF Transcript_31326/g.105470 Transcript_31326/m.105470 type:complete len:213 (-) Transcript_31326:1192-1830(-)